MEKQCIPMGKREMDGYILHGMDLRKYQWRIFIKAK